jgi:hypothetical protein
MQDQESILDIAIRFFERTLIFSFSMTLVLATLYVVGNYQEFTDRTQLQLLEIMQAIAAITTVGSLICAPLETILLISKRKWTYGVRLLLLAFIGIIAFGIVTGSSVIVVMLGAAL